MGEIKTAEEIIEEHTGNRDRTIAELVGDIFSNDNNYMEIEVKKVVTNGIPCRKIIDWSNCMSLGELPNRYTLNYPFFFEENNGKRITIVESEDKEKNIVKGRVISEKEFQRRIKVMKKAGDRLHQIRQEMKRLKNMWSGTDTIYI